jgi:hypothetical protein
MPFQGFTPTPQYRASASSRLWPARPAALCLPDPCGLGSDSHGSKAFSGKILEFLTQTGSKPIQDRYSFSRLRPASVIASRAGFSVMRRIAPSLTRAFSALVKGL